nr:hypothetical protein CFP56_32219 [Quercus suber]
MRRDTQSRLRTCSMPHTSSSPSSWFIIRRAQVTLPAALFCLEPQRPVATGSSGLDAIQRDQLNRCHESFPSCSAFRNCTVNPGRSGHHDKGACITLHAGRRPRAIIT